jgi:sulfide:quinone oxidoreductase
MTMRKISPQFYVSEQISSADVSAIAAQGVMTIICNRPDDESPGQPASNEIAAAAQRMGIKFVDLPIKPGLITDDDIDDFERARHDAPGPILAYCRSGARSISLWALASAGNLDVDGILSAAREAGYDLVPMWSRLDARALKDDTAGSEQP